MADAAVSLRFVTDTRQFVADVRKVGSETAGAVHQVEQASSRTSAIASRAVGAIANAYEDLKQQVQGIAAVTAGALGVGAVSIGSMGTSAVKAAGNFEQLRARIEGLTGSAETAGKVLEESLDFAKETPFSVEQIVQATATLEAFGQGGVENLRLVAEVASGTGQSLEDTALRFGKALSGSSEGFQGLRDTSGITAKNLEKFGARLGDVNNVALKTEKDIKAAGDALKAFAAEKFGGSIEKQAATLSGAFSNLEDEIIRLGAELGEVLIPPLTAVARYLSDFVGAVRESIAPVKELVVVGLGVAGMFTGVGSALALAAIPLAGFIAQSLLIRKGLMMAAEGLLKIPLAASAMAKASAYFSTLAAEGTAAGRAIGFFGNAANATRSAVAKLSTGIGALGSKALAFVATPMGATLGAVAVAAAAAGYAISQMEKKAVRMGEAIKQASTAAVAMTAGFRQAKAAVEAVTGADITFGAGINQSANEVRQALANIAPADAVARLEAFGLTVKDAEAAIKRMKPVTEATGKTLQTLTTLSGEVGSGFVDVATQSSEVQAVLTKIFGNKTIIQAEELNLQIARLQDEFSKGTKGIAIFEALIGKIGELPTVLADAIAKAEGLDKFLSFTSAIKDTASLREALSMVDDQLAEVRKKLDLAGISGSFFELQKRLADPSLSADQAKAIEKYLRLMESREGLEERINTTVQKSTDDRVAAYELETAKRKALGDLTLTEEQERIEQQLKMVESGTAAEVALLEKLADIEKEMNDDRAKAFAKSIDERVKAARGALNSAEAKDDSAESMAEGYRGAIRDLEAFAAANKRALAGSPEDAARLNDELDKLRNSLVEVEKAIPVERFERLAATLEKSVTKNAELSVQIRQTSSAIAALKAAIASRTVDQTKAEALLADLEEKKLDLLRQQTNEKLKQADEIAALQLEKIQQEIDILEMRKQAGEDVEDELTAAHQKAMDARLAAVERAHQAELDMIEEKRKAALAAGVSEAEANQAAQDSITHANEKAALKRGNILGEETKRRYEEEARGSNAQRVGRESYSAEAPSRSQSGSKRRRGITPLPEFADGFGESWFKRRQKPPEAPKAPDYQKIRQGVEAASAPKQTVNNNQQLSVVVNVDGKGGRTETASSPEDAVRKVRKAIADSGFFNGESGGLG